MVVSLFSMSKSSPAIAPVKDGLRQGYNKS